MGRLDRLRLPCPLTGTRADTAHALHRRRGLTREEPDRVGLLGLTRQARLRALSEEARDLSPYGVRAHDAVYIRLAIYLVANTPAYLPAFAVDIVLEQITRVHKLLVADVVVRGRLHLALRDPDELYTRVHQRALIKLRVRLAEDVVRDACVEGELFEVAHDNLRGVRRAGRGDRRVDLPRD